MQEARKWEEPDRKTPVHSLWKNRQFLLLWGASTLSLTGMQVYMLVMPLLIYEMSQSALAMSGLRVMEILPNVLLGVVAGVIVDRVNRKRIMTIMTGVMLGAIFMIVLLITFGTIQLWSLFLLGFLYSSSGYFYGNAYHSAMPQVISKTQLTEANAVFSFTETLIRMIGPGIAGVVLAISSFHGTLVIQAFCVLFMMILVLALKVPDVVKVQNKTSSFWMDIKEGVNELIGNKLVFTPTIAILFKNLASSMIIGVLIFFAVDYLNATEPEVGMMVGMSAVGGLAGALTIKKLAGRFRRGQVFTLIILLDMAAFASLYFVQVWWQVGLALALQGFAVSISNIIYLALRQELTPNRLLGRVAGTSSMLMKLTMPAGLLFAGMWAEWLTVPTLFIFAATISACLFLFMIRTSFYRTVT